MAIATERAAITKQSLIEMARDIYVQARKDGLAEEAMQCAQFRSLQSHLPVCSCPALARRPERGARTTPAARVIAGSTRLTNAKRTCGGLVDFASKITQARHTAMQDNRSGALGDSY